MADQPQPATPQAAPLEYEPAMPLLRRRWTVRSVLLLAAFIAGTAIIFTYRRFEPILQRNLAVKAIHDQCLIYSIPEGRITYRESHLSWSKAIRSNVPTATRSLSSSEARFLSEMTELGGNNRASAFDAPSAFLQTPRNGALLAPDMAGMLIHGSTFAYIRPAFLPTAGTGSREEPFNQVLFLHGRRARGGTVRLVHVEVNPAHLRADTDRADLFDAARRWFVRTRVYRPAWLLSEGTQLSETTLRQIGDLPPPQFGISFLAGPIDTADESHFTILYKLSDDSEPLTLDGWLQSDDTVRLELRPTTRPGG